jgi:hypothetical protein
MPGVDQMNSENEFSVWLFFPDDSHVAECQWVDAETAVKTAKGATLRPAAKTSLIRRVIITDGGDFTVFEWQCGKGVTFPLPHERLLEKRSLAVRMSQSGEW